MQFTKKINIASLKYIAHLNYGTIFVNSGITINNYHMKKLKKLTPYIVLIITMIIITSFQGNIGNINYDEQWDKVDNFTKKGQPKSALKIVDDIYNSAKNDENTAQIIKSLIYRISLQSSYQEDYVINSIAVFEKELQNANTPEKQILQSLIAELYQAYYNDNRWQINQRQILINDESTDIGTWDAVKLARVIEKYYNASLENESELEQIHLADYEAVLTKGELSNFTLWPTLSDLLSNRALNYFTSADAELAQIGSSKQINISNYLQPVSEFVNLKIDANISPQTKVLSIFQRLLAYQLIQGNTEALVDFDLRRLQYVIDNSSHNNVTQHNYVKALTELSDKFSNHPVFVLIAYKLADQYFIRGNNYIPEFNEDSKYDLVVADSICKVAIDKFPDVSGTNRCRNLIKKINRIDFGFDIAVAEVPDSPILSLVKFKNTSKLYFKIVAGNPKDNSNRNNLRNNILNELNQQAEVISWEQELPKTLDHRMHSVEIKIPELKAGYYIIFVSSNSKFSTLENIKFKPIWITNLSYITSTNKGGGFTDMYTLNRETGKSIDGVNITIFKRQYDNKSREYIIQEVDKLTSDKSGYAKIESIGGSNYGTYLFMFEKDGNELFSENYLNFYRKKENNKPRVKTFLFTDRAVYRPGQTVYFKGIVVEELGDKVNLLTDYNTKLDFKNASRKLVKTSEVTTNSNGSFNGAFVIPIGGLNGQMTIKCRSGNITFLVENYKLPTFEVEFDSLKGQQKLGQKVTITGKAMSYSGSVVDGASVVYRVVRRAVFPSPYYKTRGWYPPDMGREIEITNGKISTSSVGIFEFKFVALPDDNIPENTEPIFNYEISAEVTDITGEVQLANTSVSIGNKSVLLSFDIPRVVDANKINNHTISAKNLNGVDVSFDASISLFKLTPPSGMFNKRMWQKPDFFIITEEEFKQDFPHAVYKDENDKSTWAKENISNEQITIIGQTNLPSTLISELPQGEYMIIAKGIDENGQQVETQNFFTLFSTIGKKLPGKMINWFALSQKVAEPGETVKLIIGSAAKKSRVMYEIVNGDAIIERNWITVSKAQKIIDIPVKESYRGNFSINLAMIKYNRLYSSKLVVSVPFLNKKLDIKLSTFRNYLTPGTKEEWSVTISGKNGEKFSAELLAGMYDASLDIFEANGWQMNLYKNKSQAAKWESNQFNTTYSSILTVPEYKYYKPVHVDYPSINWFGYQFGGNNYIVQGTMDGGLRKSAVVPEQVSVDINSMDGDKQEDKVEASVKEENIEQEAIIPLRTNFNETAFFYPNLKTDSTGNVVFNFTTPDALTEWKIMMLAYTDDLKVGTLEQKIKSQKELMIIPNVPRFVRQGDTLLFTAKVINFTDSEIVATAQIEFFDAISMRPVSLFIKSNLISKNIGAKQSVSVSWTISIPDNISMIGYRISALAGTFSDGEERMFPVLTNRMLVTNTMPMNVSASSTANFSFEGLAKLKEQSTTLKNYRYTVEFTSNPAWYAIQALPYLSTPENKSNAALFNSYFANTLSSYIVNSNPTIKAVFESWKHHSTDAFLSNLEKNQSFKNTLLSATPWVLDAEDESEQKRRIGILFDVNRMANEKENFLSKLKEAQLPSGAWPWFKGMRDDRHTTQTIVLGMAKLHNKGVIDLSSNNQRLNMVKRAVNWLDARIIEDYAKLKKNNANSMSSYHLSSSHTQYLYLRALLVDLFPIPNSSKVAFDYYVSQEKKYWLKQSNYMQAMIALSLNKFGHRNESEAIIRSLKERSLYNKEIGMYWRENAGWNWYQAPVETQAMMIETMTELDNNSTMIEQLKIWLLKQKQTQHWNTSSATAEAVFALIMYGNNSLGNSNLVDIKVGGKTIDVVNNPDIAAEAGTGYFSTSWSGSEITMEMAELTITNPNNHMAWGSAYWQYFEDLDKIKSHKSPLVVTKKLFIEKLTNEGDVLVAIESNQVLNTGDKVVVRLTISTDRNMDYVQLTDMRATTFEPVSPKSGYSYGGGLWYYKNITDVSTDFFIRHLRKGTYVLEYPLYVTQKGDFTNGIATIQSMYAPEFAAHSGGLRVKVGEN